MKPRAIPLSTSRCQRWLPACLALASLVAAANAQDEADKKSVTRPLGEIDIVRIRELHHITDTYGDEIWPGFDTRKIPLAINNDDREELLAGHPDPPKEFHPFQGFEFNGEPVMVRDGVSRYGPSGGGWAVELGGKNTAYVGTLKQGWDTERYLALILHECFHCFQNDYRQRAEGAHGELPEDDPAYSAMIGLESRILKAAVEELSSEKVRDLARMFVAVRRERRKPMPQNLVLLEGEEEYNEGTATYSQARMYQLMAEKGGLTPLDKDKDPQHHGFPNAKTDYERMISEILPLKGLPITFFHSKYNHGMAQCLLLDRVRPRWKEEMREKGMAQFTLIEKEFPLEANTQQVLLAEASKRFDYESLLADQKKLVGERLELVRRYIDAPGRRYRMYHGAIREGLNFKPVGPVYHVPESLEKELADKRKEQAGSAVNAAGVLIQKSQFRRTVWAGGIRRFEKGSLVFESQDTPVIFGQEFLEWIDLDPAQDNSDLKIESESEQDGVYVGVKISTDGFRLEAKQARVEWSRDEVRIYPIPE